MSKNICDYDFPTDLKKMSTSELNGLAEDIREFLIDHLSKTGGHLASNLGVVELTLALHKEFNSPTDKIVWDVGHQSYVHKILTGRATGFVTLRQMDGLSGFPKTAESEHDIFDTGHASNSLSIAAGLAKARDLSGETHQTVAIIGDGALTGGLAYEGLNNIGGTKSRVIVILNDNGMSISKNIGAVSRHLNKVRVSTGYYKFKSKVSGWTRAIPVVGEGIYSGIQHFRDMIKYAVVDGVIFEQMGFTYMGPMDGHNVKTLMESMELAKHAKGPVIIHVLTEKGKGYKNAEMFPGKFHGTGPFDPATGCSLKTSLQPTYSEVFGDHLTKLAELDTKIVAITAAMTDGTGLTGFACQFPDRIFDVGIAEGHAVTFAAGLAAGGMKPFVAIYSTFLQRAYDQILIDVCLQNLPVIFAIDRAGNVGADGETHHGLFDISFLRSMPNLTILAPRDGKELEEMMDYALTLNGPCAIRYPRGSSPNLPYPRVHLSEGAQKLETGSDVTIWAVGNLVSTATEVKTILNKKGIQAAVINPRLIKPMDVKMLLETANETPWLVTLEDNVTIGGFGEQVASILKEMNYNTKLLTIGWPDQFVEHGSCDELNALYQLDAASIAERIQKSIERTS
jgi:1-deoxy-D-xylulose-5-phosphate synthase